MGNAFPTVQERTTFYFTSGDKTFESSNYSTVVRERLAAIDRGEDVSSIGVILNSIQLAVS